MAKQIGISLAIFLFLLIGTALVIIYGKGYQIRFQGGKPEIAGTGLMVLTSTPDGAQVFIDSKLTTATNNTINLPPGRYNVKIFKQGYFSWQKMLTVQKEVVAKADATLFPTAPKLESITDTGIATPLIDPSGTKIAYTISSQSAAKNGIYILNMNAPTILTLGAGATQIADDTTNQFSKATLMWSPDGQSIVASVSASNVPATYLLSSTNFTQTPQDITTTTDSLTNTWTTETKTKTDAQIQSLSPDLRTVALSSFNILAWSPDETKILYSALQNGTIPQIITPAIIGTNPTPERRNIQKDTIYVYDLKEDKNYEISNHKSQITNLKSLSWMPDSKHLLTVANKRIEIMDYDGTNRTTIYAGPFVDSFAYPWPDGSKIVILTNLGNTDITPNLYTVSLR